MQNCNDYQGLIPLYISHDLAQADQQAVAAHLEDCASCREYAQAMAKITTLVAAPIPQPQASYGSELLVNIRKQLDRQQRKNKTLHWLIPTLASAAALILILFMTVFNTHAPRMAEDVENKAADTYYELTYSGYFSEPEGINLATLSEDEFNQTEQEINSNFARYLLESDSQVSTDDYAGATAHLNEESFDALLQSMQQSTL